MNTADLETLKQAVTPVLPEDTMAEAGSKILLSDFVRMLENEAGSRRGNDPEYVHRMRVATRRMRSALRLLESYYKSKPVVLLVEQLKRLAKHLGAVRDLDIVMLNVEKCRESAEDKAAVDAVLERLDKKRSKAHKKLIAYLDSSEYAIFITKITSFLIEPGTAARSIDTSVVAPHQVRHILPTMLHEHLAAVRAYDTVLAEADGVTLHALRIEFKRLRYATAFFHEVLGASGDEFIEDIKAIQDHLGRLSDINMILSYLIDEDQEDNPVLYEYLNNLKAERETLEKDFESVWTRFNTRTVQRKLSDALLVLR